MKKFFIVIACAVLSLSASAQRASSSSSSFFSTEKVDGGVKFGIRAGVNFANATFKEDDFSYSPDSRTAFHVGVIADIPLMQSLYVQTGLFFQEKGWKIEESGDEYAYKETYKPMYLQIPILASYRYNFSDALQLQVNAGPYFAYGIGGKVKWEEDEESGEGDFFGDDSDFKRFDCGLQIGAGLTFAKHYYLGVAYEFGFSNIVDDSDMKVKNKNLMISVGYNF